MWCLFTAQDSKTRAGGLSCNVTDNGGTAGVTRHAADDLVLPLLRSMCYPSCKCAYKRSPTRLPQRGVYSDKPPSLLFLPFSAGCRVSSFKRHYEGPLHRFRPGIGSCPAKRPMHSNLMDLTAIRGAANVGQRRGDHSGCFLFHLSYPNAGRTAADVQCMHTHAHGPKRNAELICRPPPHIHTYMHKKDEYNYEETRSGLGHTSA